jgi:hypothetical protein
VPLVARTSDVLHPEWAYFDKSWQLPDIQMLR